MWKWNGAERPEFADEPGPQQESVWDYPRPPAVVAEEREVLVGEEWNPIAASRSARRVLETASPPTFYLPPLDVRRAALVAVPGSSYCEWKGEARYWALASSPEQAVAWSYPEPKGAFAALKDWIAFYPGRIACFVAGERVRPQAGDFYGGWVTDEIAGPWKGGPDSAAW